MSKPNLKPRLSQDGRLGITSRGWRLSIPPGNAQSYRLAQLDDQLGLRRSAYPWRAPARLRLRARVSAEAASGTWGFGFWNDPYGFSLGAGERFQRLPTLPQAAWFFCASQRCFLSFRDDKPGKGFYAQVFRSSGFSANLVKAFITLPFAPRTSRRLLRSIISEDGAPVVPNPCEWHAYSIDWSASACIFSIDSSAILETPMSPRGPLGIVIWIDNQYAAFEPNGRIAWGVESNASEQWLELEDLKIEAPF